MGLLALKHLFIVAEKRTKCTYFLFQTLLFLLLGAQKYYLLLGAGYPSYPLLSGFVEKSTKLFLPSFVGLLSHRHWLHFFIRISKF